MDNQEKLSILSPYLPYNLRVLDSMGRIVYLRGISLNAFGILFVRLNDKDVCSGLPKLILRPLSDLFKWVDYNDGHGLVQLGYKYGIVKGDGDYCEAYNADQCESPQAYVPLSDYNFWLFENHFDVFGLIEKGLAIDINTLESEVNNA